MILTKKFGFDAAHHLPNYDGNCRNTHGHHWSCELHVSGEYDDKTGMICDFKKLKDIIENNVISKLDHRNLNDILENPTAENIVVWIFDALVDDLDDLNLAIYKLRLWESSNSSVILNPYSEDEFDFYIEDKEYEEYSRQLKEKLNND